VFILQIHNLFVPVRDYFTSLNTEDRSIFETSLFYLDILLYNSINSKIVV